MNDIKKIIETHLSRAEAQSFLQKLTVLPYLGMVFFDAEYMKDVLDTYGDIIYMDRFMFNVQSDSGSDLTLVTMMVNFKGIGIPIAFYITKSPTVESYSMFLNEVFNDRIEKSPSKIIVPHDESLRKSCAEKFDNKDKENKTRQMSCATFFIEEITKHLDGLPKHQSLLKNMKHLALAPTKKLFESQWRSITDKRSKETAKFLHQFQKTWLAEHLPSEWAVAFQDVPNSFHNIVESWHNRVKTAIADLPQRSISDVVDFLYIEWFYNLRLLSTAN